MDNWKKFEDELPSNILGEQIDILFWHPNWSTFMRGMYTHTDEPIQDRLSEYKPDIDKFWSWQHIFPTHWFKLPETPEK